MVTPLQTFAGYVLLNRMIEQGVVYSSFLEGDDHYLESILNDLASRDWIRITGSSYQVTRKGRESYEEWINRYYEWIPRLEVFSAVDLTAGEFAFARYYDFEDDRSWDDYLNQSRFQDLRLTVCEYYQLPQGEVVFMSFLNEGRWKNMEESSGWQFDLSSGKLMEEIEEIVRKAIRIEDLGYQDPEGYITGKQVMEDVIRQGEELSLKLWEEEKKRGKSRPSSPSPRRGGLEKEAGLDDAYKL